LSGRLGFFHAVPVEEEGYHFRSSVFGIVADAKAYVAIRLAHEMRKLQN